VCVTHTTIMVNDVDRDQNMLLPTIMQ
jgi:hypothetical protein